MDDCDVPCCPSISALSIREDLFIMFIEMVYDTFIATIFLRYFVLPLSLEFPRFLARCPCL